MAHIKVYHRKGIEFIFWGIWTCNFASYSMNFCTMANHSVMVDLLMSSTISKTERSEFKEILSSGGINFKISHKPKGQQKKKKTRFLLFMVNTCIYICKGGNSVNVLSCWSREETSRRKEFASHE